MLDKDLNWPAILDIRARLMMQRVGKEKEIAFFEGSVKKALDDVKKSCKSQTTEEMCFTTMFVAEIAKAVMNGEFK